LEGDDYTAAADRLMDYMAAEPSRIYVLDGFARYLKDHLGAVSRRFGDYAVAVIVDVPELTDLKTGSKPLNEFLELIEVTEPDRDTTAQILKLAATRLAAEYGVDFDDAAPAQAIRMTNDYLLSSRNPAKAVALLEQSATEVGAVAQLHAFDGKPVDVRVGRGELAGRLAKITGLPKETILGTGADKDYVDLLGANLVGQDIAVAKAAGRLDLIQKGMVDKTLPAAVFVFAGLSGTGKSELAKQIAKVYSATHSLISFAMESFTEAHSISQLIGSPPGYVGYEEGGALINALNRDPYAVVLLDEVEKAHPKIWDPFLNLFDEGTITDTRGVTASGTKAFFVLTSNIGQYEIAQMLAAGATPEEIEERVVELLPKAEHDTARMPCFRPEFIGRIMRSGGIVAFNALSFEALRGIAGHIVSKQAANYANTHNGKLVCDDEVLDWLARRVYQDNDKVIQTNKGGYLGARPLSSLVDRYVANKLAQKLRQVASAPLVRVVLNGEDTEVVPVFDDADAQTLLAQRRLTLLNRVERRFNEIVTVPDDALGRLDETQLARMDRLLSEVGAVL
jgi:ATP-dependent Clp protease ATP-binding subunit ClpA